MEMETNKGAVLIVLCDLKTTAVSADLRAEPEAESSKSGSDPVKLFLHQQLPTSGELVKPPRFN